MARRGRPRGSGIDDRARIRAVRLAMSHGTTRRAAIIAVCGQDQLRRVETKMAGEANDARDGQRVAAIIAATYDGMGLGCRWRDEVVVEMTRDGGRDRAFEVSLVAKAALRGIEVRFAGGA